MEGPGGEARGEKADLLVDLQQGTAEHLQLLRSILLPDDLEQVCSLLAEHQEMRLQFLLVGVDNDVQRLYLPSPCLFLLLLLPSVLPGIPGWQGREGRRGLGGRARAQRFPLLQQRVDILHRILPQLSPRHPGSLLSFLSSLSFPPSLLEVNQTAAPRSLAIARLFLVLDSLPLSLILPLRTASVLHRARHGEKRVERCLLAANIRDPPL
mmetsp:Transcript_23252/g.52208  ORF Transcript_23252/g.52208 Transcript_23252/m.52208 type:complete len:210 (-) Transcript_23252:2279-2908(-)